MTAKPKVRKKTAKTAPRRATPTKSVAARRPTRALLVEPVPTTSEEPALLHQQPGQVHTPVVLGSTPSEAPPVPPAPAPVNLPKPSRARLLTPAAKRGAELVRYLRIHAKRPYGKRGENAILDMAREVGHLGRLQLGEVQ